MDASAVSEQQARPEAQEAASEVGLPLLELPVAVQEAIVKQLPIAAYKSLRCTCKDAQALVDACTTRLRFGHKGPFKDGLQVRFPRVTQLQLTGGVKRAGIDSHSWAGFSKLMAGGPWRHVTSLHLGRLSGRAALEAISRCADVEECVLEQCKLGPGAPLLRHISAALPKLISLACTTALGDEELGALAACSGLVALEVKLDECGAGGWGHLMQLKRLESLHLTLKSPTSLPGDALVTWVTALTALTSLVLVELGEMVSWAQEGVTQLQLPPSLVTLRLQGCGLPLPQPGLPNLVALELTWGFQLTDAGLAAVARACPVLHRLAVSELDLTAACHGEPLQTLGELRVYSRCTAAGGFRFARAFPQLLSLSLACHCSAFDAGVHGFEGASCLEVLDLGHSSRAGNGSYTQLKASDFAVLASLPQLLELRCNATSQHVQGLCALTRLQGITFVCSYHMCDDLAALSAAFNSCCAPDQLYLAAFEFLDHTSCTSLYRLATAAQAWVLQSVLLTHLEWADQGSKGDVALVNDIGLYALAAHPNIIHITVTGGDISAAMLQRVRQLHAACGLKVVVNGRAS